MQVFYLSDIILGNNFLGSEESHHCSKVLRMKQGAEALFIDGKGTMAEGEVLKTDPKKSLVNVKIIHENYKPRPYRLHIAISPTKNNSRFEWFLEKSTEIGIDEITPLLCERSERKIVNSTRSGKIIRSAMKQSITAFEPILHDMVSFTEFITNSNCQNIYMAYCGDDINKYLEEVAIANSESTVIIGPEGGFSPHEVEMAKSNNLDLVSLGNSRLRTETAGIVSCHTFSLINQ